MPRRFDVVMRRLRVDEPDDVRAAAADCVAEAVRAIAGR